MNGGEADKSGTSAAYSHKEVDNGNILLRSRDTKYETKTKYWLLFKSVDSIFFKCYKKTVPVSPDIKDTSGTAEADLKFANAKAEERRAADVALEQEMKAKVVEAEAEIPLAMAEAFRSGNMGIMDYYNLKNIQSDTDMRNTIADNDDDE